MSLPADGLLDRPSINCCRLLEGPEASATPSALLSFDISECPRLRPCSGAGDAACREVDGPATAKPSGVSGILLDDRERSTERWRISCDAGCRVVDGPATGEPSRVAGILPGDWEWSTEWSTDGLRSARDPGCRIVDGTVMGEPSRDSGPPLVERE